MFRRSRNLILVVIAACAGALIGRWVAEARARLDRGEDPLALDLNDLQVRPQDIIPGVVAAFRVGEPPWSWFRLPGWLAAFGTNFVTSAIGGDLDRLRKMAEERAFSALGLDPDVEIEVEDVPPAPMSASDPVPATEAPVTPPPPQAAAPPPRPQSSDEQPPVWTSSNTIPPAANGAAPDAETPGFTPLRD